MPTFKPLLRTSQRPVLLLLGLGHLTVWTSIPYLFSFFPLFSFSSHIDVTEIPQTGSWLQLIQNGTTQFNTGANGIQQLDRFIQFAKMANIFVYFSLTNNWFPSINQVNPNPSPRNFLSNDYGQSVPDAFRVVGTFS
jgi:hypothetical protein